MRRWVIAVAPAADDDVAANCVVVPLHYVFNGTGKAPRVANGNPRGFIWHGSTYVASRWLGESLGRTVQRQAARASVTLGRITCRGDIA